MVVVQWIPSSSVVKYSCESGLIAFLVLKMAVLILIRLDVDGRGSCLDQLRATMWILALGNVPQ